MHIVVGVVIQFESQKEKDDFDKENGKVQMVKLNDHLQRGLDKFPPVWKRGLTSRVDLIFAEEFSGEKTVE